MRLARIRLLVYGMASKPRTEYEPPYALSVYTMARTLEVLRHQPSPITGCIKKMLVYQPHEPLVQRTLSLFFVIVRRTAYA